MQNRLIKFSPLAARKGTVCNVTRTIPGSEHLEALLIRYAINAIYLHATFIRETPRISFMTPAEVIYLLFQSSIVTCELALRCILR